MFREHASQQVPPSQARPSFNGGVFVAVVVHDVAHGVARVWRSCERRLHARESLF